MVMKHIHEIAERGLAWVNVTRQAEKEVQEIRKRFGIELADAQECLPPFQRPKIVKRDHYYFLILHFPVFDRETKRLGFTELDIFLSPNFLITIHDDKLPAIGEFFNVCAKDKEVRARFFDGTMAHVLLELLAHQLEAIFPILLHINEDINAVDRKLFGKTPDKHMAEEILRLKTNVVTFRRAMQGHKTVLERLVCYADKDLGLVRYQTYLNALRESTQEIWHMIESQRESVDALHETNESILTLKTNEVMKTLTVISVLTFPMTLLATILAIRAPGTPLVDYSYGFLGIISLTVVGVLVMLVVFKKKNWL